MVDRIVIKTVTSWQKPDCCLTIYDVYKNTMLYRHDRLSFKEY